MTDKLARNNKALGQAVLDEADALLHKQKQQAVLHTVTEIMKKRDGAVMAVDQYLQHAIFYRDKLKAIEKGEFDINSRDGKITFRNPELNADHADVIGQKYSTIEEAEKILKLVFAP